MIYAYMLCTFQSLMLLFVARLLRCSLSLHFSPSPFILYSVIVVAFELPSYTVSEGDESVEVCVVVVQGLLGETAFSFFYSLSEDTATGMYQSLRPDILLY